MRIGLAYAAALQLLVLPGLAAAQNRQPAETPPVLIFAGSIPLGKVDGRMDHMSADLKGQRLFSAAYDNHTLEVIDLKAGKVVKELELNEPQNSSYFPSVNRLFVSSSGDGTVKIFDATTFALVNTVQLSSDADNMRFDARRNHVLVNYGERNSSTAKSRAGKGRRTEGWRFWTWTARTSPISRPAGILSRFNSRDRTPDLHQFSGQPLYRRRRS